MIPMHVIEFPDRLPIKRLDELETQLKGRGMTNVLILDGGAKYKRFDGMPIPDAICTHCGRANLQSAYQCLGCNAPLVK